MFQMRTTAADITRPWTPALDISPALDINFGRQRSVPAQLWMPLGRQPTPWTSALDVSPPLGRQPWTSALDVSLGRQPTLGRQPWAESSNSNEFIKSRSF